MSSFGPNGGSERVLYLTVVHLLRVFIYLSTCIIVRYIV